MTRLETALSWRGHTMYDQDGDKIGRIEEIYLDHQTDQPEWALVNTGLFGSKSTFVPIQDADPSDDGVRVPFEKGQVKDAPGIDPEGELSQQQESELYAHYGMDYGDDRSDSRLPEAGAVGRDPSGPATDDAGRARLRRHGVDQGIRADGTDREGGGTSGVTAGPEAEADRRTT